ncbi:MAG: lactonase family protein [Armatimonadetes bacterium]|nr:lactonase family protein [Armatimonadota bacterium]PIU64246.1 MAG: 6-phosphogluconolactonase [Armatimonadetes bacterium CG07_land_8_20_14_0_80_59_28]PIX38199.1 MAG: 6-phosphogluconolactonase [Armatimonadetes bacterium CG_4_8_14_3_um_filter_58_9]PIY43912.1 MAG: 6-phosphogluconolactonase [Armatimonadetes bacterium CG_4_10_14_3_um_filter_59_10]PJB68889.1 MAG: 6-phosphogluconolactonase [Armatimonadetes bacterium CG_4_9_14_3_um_filter_58_7]
MLAYIGTGNDEKGKGIHLCEFDPETGGLTNTGHVVEDRRPAFIALHPYKQFLYSTSQVQGAEGKPTGGVSAYAINPADGHLTFLNRQASRGEGPCHLTVDASGRYVLVANYSSGSVALLPLAAEGSLEEATDFDQHEGASVDEKRQQGPYAHSIFPDPTNRFALSCDLGIDKVLVYKLDLENGKLISGEQPWASMKPGAGPRHLDFHPNGKIIYVINELNNTVTGFRWDAREGTLEEFQHASTLPKGYTETTYCADIHVHPNGKFLFGTNRGHNSIAVFRMNDASGELDLTGLEPCGGDFPWNFTLDPGGRWMIVANQRSNNLVVFAVDPETGSLAHTAELTGISSPRCVKLVALPC